MTQTGIEPDPGTRTGLGLSPAAAASLMTAVASARWFAGKGRRVEFRSFTPLPWLNEEQAAGADSDAVAEVPRVRLAVLEVGYPDGGGVQYYQLPLAYRHRSEPAYATAELFVEGDVTVYDATQDVAGARVLLDALLEQRDVGSGDPETPGATIATTRFHLRDVGPLNAELVPQVFRGQQSNTSVMFGDTAILKVFRRLELGRNLDIQVHSALNDAGVADVARLFGWAEATWTSGGEVLGADLAMCVEKLADAVDGWDLALASLEADSRRTATAAQAEDAGFAEHAQSLGQALALTHHALRDAFGSADQPGSAVTDVMTRRLDAAVAVAPALEPYAEGLRARFAAIGGHHLDAQRVHGDFHLGQTLHTPSGWKIIDFEGEPAKSLAERVAPDSVWRDVAGMMRSFDYASASVPGTIGAAWRDACRVAFLRGYSGADELDADAAALLAAYEADKAIYEVVYEVRNRPDWVGIPLGAVAALATDPTPDPTPEPAARLNEEQS